MVCNLLFYALVLLEELGPHFSCRSCFHNDLFVGEVLRA